MAIILALTLNNRHGRSALDCQSNTQLPRIIMAQSSLFTPMEKPNHPPEVWQEPGVVPNRRGIIQRGALHGIFNVLNNITAFRLTRFMREFYEQWFHFRCRVQRQQKWPMHQKLIQWQVLKYLHWDDSDPESGLLEGVASEWVTSLLLSDQTVTT